MSGIQSYTLHLLGPVRVSATGDGALPRFRSQRTQALLGYLVVNRRPVTREKLAALFWPDQSFPTGRANLRRELHNLNLLLPGCWQIDQATVQFSPSAETVVDIYEAERLEANGEWMAAADWLHGEFMEGIAVPDSPDFESWLTGQRERRQQQMERILLQASGACRLAGDSDMAQRLLHRLLRRMPWHEEGHRRLMLLLARRGHFDAALRQFRRCRDALVAELDVFPSADTAALYQRIRAAAAHPAIPLPPMATPLIGRDAEMALLKQGILDPDCRLLTIIGLGGIGKSHLALQTVHHLTQGDGRCFLHGGAFVSLADVPADRLAPAIAGAIGLVVPHNDRAEEILVGCLADKELLLLLDGCDQGVPVARLVERILAEAPGITLLVTAGRRLRLREERLFVLDGLPCTCAANAVASADSVPCCAVRLFVSVAEHTTGQPLPVAEHREALSHICRLVGGVPLALVLAATWSDKLSPAEIAAEIGRNLDFLRSRYHNMPPGHQTVRAVFDAAWSRLTETEQAVFAALSVFRAGFTEEAARQVAGATPALLQKMVDRTLVAPNGNGRYSLHQLLRLYADEQLQASGRAVAIQRQHLACFVALAEACEAELDGPTQAARLNQLEDDRENVESALAWAFAHREIGQAARLAGAMGAFWAIRGWLSAGLDWLNRLPLDNGRLSVPVRAKALRAAGWLAFEAGKYDQAGGHYAAALADCRQTGQKEQVADLLNRLGHVAQRTGELTQAAALYEESLELFQQLNLTKGIALALNRVGHVRQLLGQYERATTLVTESLALRRSLGDKRGVASSLNALAEMSRLQGKHEEAVAFYRECLALCEELGDRRCISGLSHNLGHALHRLGQPGPAVLFFRRGLIIAQELGDQEGIALCLAGLAGVRGGGGDAQLAARLFGTAEALLEAIPHHLNPADRSTWQDNLARLEARLDQATLQKARHAGRQAPVSQSIHLALNAACSVFGCISNERAQPTPDTNGAA